MVRIVKWKDPHRPNKWHARFVSSMLYDPDYIRSLWNAYDTFNDDSHRDFELVQMLCSVCRVDAKELYWLVQNDFSQLAGTPDENERLLL